MRPIRFALLGLALSLLPPASATAEPDPTSPTIEDAITQPLADVNLKRKDLPAELIAIRDRPYALEQRMDCRAISREVKTLNAVLGPDFDEVEIDEGGRRRKEGVATAAGSFVASLIPFRFLIREISGASKADRDYREAIYAGIVRRSFLKGLGEAHKCAAPARPLKPSTRGAKVEDVKLRGKNGE